MKAIKTANPKSPAQQPAVVDVPWSPGLGVLFVAVVYFVAQLTSGLLISIYPWARHWGTARADGWLNNSVAAQFLFVLLAEGMILYAIYRFLKRYNVTFATIGLKRPKGRDVLSALTAVPVYYVLYILTVGVVSHYVTSLNVNQAQDIGFNNVHGGLPMLLTFVSLVILPPIAEEIMVRGFLYSSLKKALPTVYAVLLTSAIFASAHLPEGGSAGPLYIAALDTFVLSLVLIYLREKTGSLWASIGLHAIKNGIAFVALFVAHAH